MLLTAAELNTVPTVTVCNAIQFIGSFRGFIFIHQRINLIYSISKMFNTMSSIQGFYFSIN